MKNKNGFTLMEMIAVIGIISLMALLVLPEIINQLGEKKKNIGDTTKSLIYASAELYFTDRVMSYPKTVGKIYCVKLEKLVEAEYLKSPLKDLENGSEINLNRLVQTKISSYKEYSDFVVLEESETCEAS